MSANEGTGGFVGFKGLELVSIFPADEQALSGADVVFRSKAEEGVYTDEEQAHYLRENRADIPEGFRPYNIVFPGVQREQGGCLQVLYFFYDESVRKWAEGWATLNRGSWHNTGRDKFLRIKQASAVAEVLFPPVPPEKSRAVVVPTVPERFCVGDTVSRAFFGPQDNGPVQAVSAPSQSVSEEREELPDTDPDPADEARAPYTVGPAEFAD